MRPHALEAALRHEIAPERIFAVTLKHWSPDTEPQAERMQ
jgi:hypothetical protein